MPTRDPVHAGLAVASIAGLAIAAFAGLARGAVGWPVVIVVGIAYLLPFAYYKQQENAHHRAVAREYEALKREDEA